ncbi:trichothecene C-8 hydroxylase [Xylariaceae sp. FL1019]|nr:trichothecene C-8 hydroxylase [Xylariaceae sp. FL1019]
MSSRSDLPPSGSSSISPGETNNILNLILAVSLGFIFFLRHSKSTDYPVVNPRKWFEFSNARVKKDFMINARALVHEGLKRYPGRPFKVNTDMTDMIVLPNEYADEIRNIRELSFPASIRKHFYSDLKSFESMAPAGGNGCQLAKSVVQRQLTHQLAYVTQPLSEKCTTVLQEVLTDNKDWHELPSLMQSASMIVYRLSSRVLLGDELCHDEEWRKIVMEHTTTVMDAVLQIRMWPSILRPIVHWVLPSCRESRMQLQRSREIIDPVIQRRRKLRRELIAKGETPKMMNDGLEWLDENAKGEPYDAAILQLALSMVAMHTTTDLLTQCLIDIMTHPEIIEPLRKEVIETMGKGRWNRTSLQNLKLLDSVLKETQRLKPIEMATMKRVALRDVKLSDGSRIPKGADVIVYAGNHWDPNVYEDPNTWNPYRFHNRRLAAKNEKDGRPYLLSSTSTEHMAFGHGLHACPGRFFVADEIKVALCHLILKYDWKSSEGSNAEPITMGFTLLANPVVKVMVKRREEEISLENNVC